MTQLFLGAREKKEGEHTSKTEIEECFVISPEVVINLESLVEFVEGTELAQEW